MSWSFTIPALMEPAAVCGSAGAFCVEGYAALLLGATVWNWVVRFGREVVGICCVFVLVVCLPGVAAVCICLVILPLCCLLLATMLCLVSIGCAGKTVSHWLTL